MQSTNRVTDTAIAFSPVRLDGASCVTVNYSHRDSDCTDTHCTVHRDASSHWIDKFAWPAIHGHCRFLQRLHNHALLSRVTRIVRDSAPRGERKRPSLSSRRALNDLIVVNPSFVPQSKSTICFYSPTIKNYYLFSTLSLFLSLLFFFLLWETARCW